ncbi:MAG TPA: hypothetical protein VKW76_05935 [Candidatus Binatia bacterium]|nr:hypothetical protein [Candidatus Binatia bacterium]
MEHLSAKRRRLLGWLGRAVVIGGGVLSGGFAWAGSTVYTTSGATVVCNTVIGTASINPPITSASTGSATIKVKATLGGCSVTGASPASPALTVVSGSIGGTLTTSGAPGCAGLISPATISGNLVAKWKVASGQKLDFGSTTVSGGSIVGSLFVPGGSLMGSYGEFTLSGSTLQPSSAFAGGTPGFVAVTSEDVVNLGTQCAGPVGIKTIHLSIGTLTL